MNLSWGKLSTKHKSMIFAGGLLLATWLYYSYIIEVQNQRLAELTVLLQSENQKLAIVQGFARKYPEPAVYLAEIGKNAMMIEKILPNQPDIGGLLTQVDQAAKSSGLQLVEVKPAATVNKTSYREIPVEIIVKGSFTQTTDFIKKIENISRFNSINHVLINSRQGILDSKLVFTAYSYGVLPGTAVDKQVQIVPHQH